MIAPAARPVTARQPLHHTWRRGETFNPDSTPMAILQGLQVDKPTRFRRKSWEVLEYGRRATGLMHRGRLSIPAFLHRITVHVLYTHVINKLECQAHNPLFIATRA